jgi:hypothetical protein
LQRFCHCQKARISSILAVNCSFKLKNAYFLSLAAI